MPHDNLTPLQKLEAIPKVWLVWFDGGDCLDPAFIYNIYRTQEAALAAVSEREEDEQKYFSIEWQPVLG